MTPHSAELPSGPSCPICALPVELETAKTDDDGKAIHEQCYVSVLSRKNEATLDNPADINATPDLAAYKPNPFQKQRS